MISNLSKVLVLDVSSYVGGHLFNHLGKKRAVGTYFRSPIAGCRYFDALSMGLADVVHNPEECSHAVILFADTKPDSCAADVVKSRALNVDSTKRVIDRLVEWQIKPIFASTESVFDGVSGNYVESDTPNPILIYGQQKLEIEEYLQDYCQHFTIVRLAKVFGSQRGDSTLFTSWLDAIARSEIIHCAYDQVFSPIHVEDVVESISRLIDLDCDGVYHIANTGAYSRIQLLYTLLDQLREISSVEVKVVPCSIHDFDLTEKRPLDVSMTPGKLIKSTGIQIKSIEEAVGQLVTSVSDALGSLALDTPRPRTGSRSGAPTGSEFPATKLV